MTSFYSFNLAFLRIRCNHLNYTTKTSLITGETAKSMTCENSATVLCSEAIFSLDENAAPANKVSGNYCNSPKTGRPVECIADTIGAVTVLNGDYACAVS